MMGKIEIPDLSKNPWGMFIYLALVNGILGYGVLSLEAKLWVSIFLFLTPVFIIFYSTKSAPRLETFAWDRDVIKPPSLWMLIVVISAGILLHLVGITKFLNWPLLDESDNAYFALQLHEKWNWYPFFFYSQLPPFFIWLLTLVFKITQPSLFGIWVLPALISVLIILLVYPTFKLFFTASFSFLYLCLTVTGFWLLYFGRLSHQGILLVFWEFAAFYLLGRYWNGNFGIRRCYAVLLGLWLGLGFYTYFSWPLVFISVFSFFYWKTIKKTDRGPKLSGWVLMSALLAVGPLILAALTHGYGSYIHGLLPFQNKSNLAFQIQASLSCLTALFWDNGWPEFFYGPSWGGFLNPVMGALFFIGLLEFYRFRNRPFAKWTLASLLLFVSPALMTNNITDMREIQVFPLLSLVALVGLQRLVWSVKKGAAVYFIVALLACTTALDLVHLLKARDFLNGYWKVQKAEESYKTFSLLTELNQRKGPGYFLDDLSNVNAYYKDQLNIHDQTLSVATYPFNAVRNPRFNDVDAKWIALLLDLNYQPFLSARFPESFSFDLSSGREEKDRVNGGLMLWILPCDNKYKEVINRWVEANLQFRDITWQAMHISEKQPRSDILKLMPRLYPFLKGDPMLESLYWQMIFANNNWETIYGDGNRKIHYPAAFAAVQNAIQKGYPTAYFYNELGSFLVIEKKYDQAREAFLKAVHCQVNYTPALENLQQLERVKSGNNQ